MVGLQGRIVGGNVGGRVFLVSAVELGNPDGANSPLLHFRRGSVLLAAASAVLLDLAGAQVPAVRRLG